MNNKKSFTILILSIIALILALCIFVFIFKVIENKNTHTTSVLTVIEEKIKEKENMASLEKEFDKIQDINTTINKYLLDPNQIDIFVPFLEKFGTDANTEVSVKSVGVIPKEKNKILVKISIVGTFTNVMKTISLLENSSYQIDILDTYLNKTLQESVSSNKTKTVSKDPVWQGSVSFSIITSS